MSDEKAEDYAKIYKDTILVDLWYPRIDNRPGFVEVGLVDVRAADSIRISYDFERDGWKIEQAKFFSWDDSDTTDQDPGWEEVAFCQAWQKEVRGPLDGEREP